MGDTFLSDTMVEAGLARYWKMNKYDQVSAYILLSTNPLHIGKFFNLRRVLWKVHVLGN